MGDSPPEMTATLGGDSSGRRRVTPGVASASLPRHDCDSSCQVGKVPLNGVSYGRIIQPGVRGNTYFFIKWISHPPMFL